MHLKTFIAAAVVALTAACNRAEQAEQTEQTTIELNDDGSIANAVADNATAADEAQK